MMKRFFFRLFSRRAAFIVLFVFACLATIIVAFYVEEGWRGRRAWAAYKAAAASRSVKLTFEEYLPAPIPDSQNFAAIPVFQELFKAQQAGKPVPAPFALPVESKSKNIRWPERSDLLRAERINLTVWRDFFINIKLLDASSTDAAQDVLRALEHYGPALQQIREAGSRPASRFPVQWIDGLYYSELPHLQTIHNAAVLIGLRMSAHLALHDSASAYADFSDELNLYRALRNEPLEICGLVRVSIVTLLVNGVWDGLAGHQWAEPQLRALQTDIDALNLMDDYRFSIGSERGSFNSILGALTENGASGLSKMFVFEEREFFSSLYPRGWVLQNQVILNELFDERIARVDSKSGIVQPSFFGKTDFDRMFNSSIWRRIYYALANSTMPGLDSSAYNHFAAHTRVEQTQLACALERFHLSNNGYPLHLEELVPQFISSIPRDVMDGAPMRYHRTPNGSFELWSIAMNRQDDSAAVMPNKKLRDQPDWVWRYPAAANVAFKK